MLSQHYHRLLESDHDSSEHRKIGNYVTRIVKKNTGMSLLDYGKIFLLEHARQLLINTNLSVQEIVEKLGYSNRYYFNRIFIERYQVTPSEFRKLNRMKSN